MRAIILTAGVALCLIATGASADQLIFLEGGRVFQGEVLESTADSVKIKRELEGGGEEIITVSAEECDPHFFYSVRDKAIGDDDAAGRIELAKYAVENEMFSRAKAQMDKARAADMDVVNEFMKTEFPKIKNGLADRLLEAAKRALRRGSTKNAKKYASFILTKFEGTPAEPEAEKLLDQVQAKIDEENAAKSMQRHKMKMEDEARDAAAIKKTHDEFLGQVERLIDEADKANTLGLKAKSVTQGKHHFETAAAKYENAIRKADELVKKSPSDQTTAALQEMRGRATEEGVTTYLNLAFNLAARGSYQEAVTYVNKALALDPDNAEAKAARATISTSGGWGRRRGGRR